MKALIWKTRTSEPYHIEAGTVASVLTIADQDSALWVYLLIGGKPTLIGKTITGKWAPKQNYKEKL